MEGENVMQEHLKVFGAQTVAYSCLAVQSHLAVKIVAVRVPDS